MYFYSMCYIDGEIIYFLLQLQDGFFFQVKNKPTKKMTTTKEMMIISIPILASSQIMDAQHFNLPRHISWISWYLSLGALVIEAPYYSQNVPQIKNNRVTDHRWGRGLTFTSLLSVAKPFCFLSNAVPSRDSMIMFQF